MGTSFHHFYRRCQAAIGQGLTQIQAERPKYYECAISMREHYKNSLPKQDQLNHLAMICLILEDDVRKAVTLFHEKSNKIMKHPTTFVMRALHAAPQEFLKDEQYLYAKGIIRTASKFMLVPPGIEKGSLMDSLRAKIHPDLNPFMLHAIEWGIGRNKHHKDFTVGHFTLNYIAVQLLSESEEKVFTLNNLSMQSGAARHYNELKNSFAALNILEQELGISLKDYGIKLVSGSSSIKQTLQERKKGSLPVLPAFDTAPAADNKLLLKTLRGLVERGEISQTDARIYHFYSDIKNNHTIPGTAIRFGRSEEEVSHAITTVGAIVADTSKPIKAGVKKSGGYLHQPGTVRP